MASLCAAAASRFTACACDTPAGGARAARGAPPAATKPSAALVAHSPRQPPVGAEAEDAKIEKLLKEMAGKTVASVIAAGSAKLASVPSGGGGGGGGAPAAAAPAAGGAAAKKEEPKKEEKKARAGLDDARQTCARHAASQSRDGDAAPARLLRVAVLQLHKKPFHLLCSSSSLLAFPG